MRTHWFLFAAVLLAVPSARPHALEPLIVNPNPGSFDEIEEIVGTPRSQEGGIIDYLEKNGVCGGWNREEHVGAALGDKIAKVTGVPGRQSKPLGLITMGTAMKDPELSFPATVKGLVTACLTGRSAARKRIWSDSAQNGCGAKGGREEKNTDMDGNPIVYPYFEDTPPCTWQSSPRQNRSSEEAPGQCGGPKEHTPEYCIDFCVWLNTFTYMDCGNGHGDVVCTKRDDSAKCGTQEVNNAKPPPAKIKRNIGKCLEWKCKKKIRRFVCTDAPVPADIAALCSPGTNPLTLSNSRGCSGDSCRCSAATDAPVTAQQACGQAPPAVGASCSDCTADMRVQAPDEPSPNPYQSYLRRYEDVRTERAQVPGVPGDATTLKATIACYGFYREFDPARHKTEVKDRRCVIDLNVNDLAESQVGRGMYGRETAFIDPDPEDPENMRDGGAFNGEQDTWYRRLGGAFSLLNVKHAGKNLLFPLLQPDTARHIAGYPIAKETSGRDAYLDYPEMSTQRAFDDTGLRIVANWWQDQSTRMHTLFNPPLIRLLLPAGWLLSIDPVLPVRAESVLPSALPLQPIDVQIKAREGLLGELAASMLRSFLLRLREEPVTVTVPVNDPVELRILAGRWCVWWIKTHPGAETCNDAPTEMHDLMNMLEQYADQMENVRRLRTLLTRQVSAALRVHRMIAGEIGTWFLNSLNDYRAYLQRHKELAEFLFLHRQMQALWQEIGKTNEPWCMNHRFTPAVNALVDPWLPSRGSGGILSAAGLPEFPRLPSLTGAVLDFSMLHVPPDAMALPVIKPVEVRLDVHALAPPPDAGGHFPRLAPIQPIQPIIDAVLATTGRLETLTVVGRPTVSFPTLLTDDMRTKIGLAFTQTAGLLRNMNTAYRTFWCGIDAYQDEQRACEPRCREIRREQMDLECARWGEGVCVYSEMELIETLTRFASRPGIQLAEDIDASGTVRQYPAACLPEDEACMLLAPEDFGKPRTGWVLDAPARPVEDALLDQLRQRLWKATLPQRIGDIPPNEAPPYAVEKEELLPPLNVTPDVPLVPEPPDET